MSTRSNADTGEVEETPTEEAALHDGALTCCETLAELAEAQGHASAGTFAGTVLDDQVLAAVNLNLSQMGYMARTAVVMLGSAIKAHDGRYKDVDAFGVGLSVLALQHRAMQDEDLTPEHIH